jgi:hypothetical protein
MARSDESVKSSQSSKNFQRTKRYILKPALHPNGWKLEVTEGTGALLFTVLSHPTIPPHFKLHPAHQQKTHPMRIKFHAVKDVRRYTLLKDKQELLSILQTPHHPLVSVRNPQRETIARFSLLSSEIVLLRAIPGSVARLRIKERPEPLRFQIETEAQPGDQWLHAIILYAIALIESSEPTPFPEEEKEHDEDMTPEKD